MLVQGELPFLWPDDNGSLSLHQPFRARSSGLRSPHLRLSPRREVVRASRLLQSRSLSSWLLLKSFRAVGFGTVKESLFEMWLSDQLETCDFGALELDHVVGTAVADLELEAAEIIGLLIRVTRTAGAFKSDGEIITRR